MKPLSGKDTFTIIPMLLRPKSKGYITLRSASPLDHPIITHNYFTHPEDMHVMVEGGSSLLLQWFVRIPGRCNTLSNVSSVITFGRYNVTITCKARACMMIFSFRFIFLLGRLVLSDSFKVFSYFQNLTWIFFFTTPGIKIAIEIAHAPAFRKLGSRLYEVIMPGCYHVKPWTDDYWECLARHSSFTIYHPCGTAKMGPYWDPYAVVDPQLK